MKKKARLTLVAALPVAAVGLTPGVASAHPVGAGGDFLAGLIHPFLGADHVLAIAAVGLLAARSTNGPWWQLPAVFTGALAAGWLSSLSGAAVPALNALLVLSVVVFFVLARLAPGVWAVLSILLTGVFGLLHGYAHGSEVGASSQAILGGVLATSTLMLAAAGAAGVALSKLIPARPG